MKKLFISAPMKGRTEESIRKSMEKMHKMAELVFDQELEVIPSYIEDKPPKDSSEAVWYLGRSIQLMSEADYFIGIDDWDDIWSGCQIEKEIARRYNIPSYTVRSDIFEDVRKIKEERWANECANAVPVRRLI